MNKLASVVIPVFNEEKDIGECLASLLNQSFKNIDIIAVDDGSTDKSSIIIKEFKKKNKNITLLTGKHQGPGASRNFASRRAKGDILVFVDSDMTFEKNYIKNLINPILKNKKIIGTTHELELVKNTNNIWSKCWGRIRVSKEEAKDVKIFRAIRKKEFFKLGGFDPKYGYADDQTFWFKYKIKPIAAKNTVCYHKNPGTLMSVYRQSRWIGASIDHKLLNIPIIKYISPLALFLLSPLIIIYLSIKKTYKNKSINIFHYMLIFMTFRYFGTIEGIIRNIFFNKNYR